MDSCIFCKIAGGEIPAPLVYEDGEAVVFRDIEPQAPVHLLVVPRQHLASLKEVQDERFLGRLLLTARLAAAKAGLDEYRIVVNTGAQAGQSVFHLHLHVLGGRVMAWPPG